jgi:hypothetical protein
MPPLQTLKILGNLIFFSKQYKLPVATATANGGDKGWSNDYFKDRKQEQGEMMGIPQTIPPWFMPQKPGYKPHQDSCDKVGKNFKDFHDACIDAVAYAHNMWRLQAKFKDLKVMSVSAIGTPGCLDGPELENDIKNAPMCATFNDNGKEHLKAVAKGVSDCFKDWQGKVMVPGLPWYPAFAAFPGPMAPPMPNIPMPLITCPSAMMAKIVAPSGMAKAMDDALSQKMKDMDPEKHYEGLHLAIATVLSIAFLMWMPMQQVMLVMGKGPCPAFAPPFVPMGPVVGGDNISAPGHLMV